MKLLSPKIFINGNKTGVVIMTENCLTGAFCTAYLLFLFAPNEQGCLEFTGVYIQNKPSNEMVISLTYVYPIKCQLFANIINPHINQFINFNRKQYICSHMTEKLLTLTL